MFDSSPLARPLTLSESVRSIPEALADARANPLSRLDAAWRARQLLTLTQYSEYALLCAERGVKP